MDLNIIMEISCLFRFKIKKKLLIIFLRKFTLYGM